MIERDESRARSRAVTAAEANIAPLPAQDSAALLAVIGQATVPTETVGADCAAAPAAGKINRRAGNE